MVLFTESVLSKGESRGWPYKDHRQVLNGIFWILRPGEHGPICPSATAREDGLRPNSLLGRSKALETIVRHLRELDAEGSID